MGDARGPKLLYFFLCSMLSLFLLLPTAAAAAEFVELTIPGLFYPSGLASDSQGNLYVANSFKHQILKVDRNGNVARSWGGQGSYEGYPGASNAVGGFYFPKEVDVDQQGNLYVADTKNNRIQKFDSNSETWTVLGKAGNNLGEFTNPSAVTVDSAGNIYVGESGFDTSGKQIDVARVQKYTPGTGTWTEIPYTTGYKFKGISGLAVDNSYLYVADALYSYFNGLDLAKIKWYYYFTPAVSGVAVDQAGNIYLAYRDSVQEGGIWVPKGVVVKREAGSWNIVQKWLIPSFPEGLKVDQAGNIFVTYAGKVAVCGSPLTVTSTTPSQDATGVAVGDITVTFNKNLLAGSELGGITVTKADQTTITCSSQIKDNTLIIKPGSPWEANAVYTVSVPAGAVKDHWDTNSTAYTFSFTTGSTEGTLSNLVVSGGALEPVFSPWITDYTVNVAADVENVTVTPTAGEGTSITVTGQTVNSGEASTPIKVDVGNNTLSVTATTGGGTKNYSIKVVRDKPLDALAVSAGTMSPSFNSAVTAYTLNLGSDVTSITVTPTAGAVRLKINGVENPSGAASTPINLTKIKETIKIELLGQDDTVYKTYTLEVIRSKSSNADLASITFNSEVTWEQPLPHNSPVAQLKSYTNSIIVTLVMADASATVNVNRQAPIASGQNSEPITLVEGLNLISLAVTAHDGTTKNYTLWLRNPRDLSNVSYDIAQGTITGLKNYMEYSVDSSDGTDGHWACCGDASTANNVPFKSGKVYVRQNDHTSNLRLLATLEETAAPGVTADTAAGLTAVKLVGATSAMQYSRNGGSTWQDVTEEIAAGRQAIDISTAPNNDLRVRVKATASQLPSQVTDKLVKSSNNTLKNINLGEITLTPNFNSNITTYEATAAKGTIKLKVIPTTEDIYATVTVNGQSVESGHQIEVSLLVGDNPVTIIVRAEDGTSKTYEIAVKREAEPLAINHTDPANGATSVAVNKNISLLFNQNIRVGSGIGNLTLNKAESVVDYVYGVHENILTIDPVSNLDYSSIYTVNVPTSVVEDVYGNSFAAPFSFSFTTAADKPEPPEQSDNANLSGLQVSQGTLNPVFSSGIIDYTVNVEYGVTGITLTPTTAGGYAVIKVNGVTVTSGQASQAINLRVGDTVIAVLVTAQDGKTSKTYTITVRRAANNSGGDGSGSSSNSSTAENQIGTTGIITVQDKIVEAAIKEQSAAMVNLNQAADGKARITVEAVHKLVQENVPLVIANTGVTVQYSPQALLLGQLTEATNEPNNLLEVGVKEISPQEKQALLDKAPLGQSTGLFDIGGMVVELTAELVNNGDVAKRQKIESFLEPVAVTIDLGALGKLTPEQIAQLTAVRYERGAAGNITPVKLGGTYDPATRKFTFYTDKFSFYSVVQAEKLTRINLTLDQAVTLVNGKSLTLDAQPTILNNRTMVPLRFISEAFGAEVTWQAATQTVTIQLDGKELTLTIGRPDPGLDVPAAIVHNRTLVPVRYISECLGANVKWFPSKRLVEIIR